MKEIEFPKPLVHLFVCLNQRVEPATKPSCGNAFTLENFLEVKAWIRSKNWVNKVYCTKTLCLGFCNPQGAVARIFPSGRYFSGITSLSEVQQIVTTELQRIGEPCSF